MKKTDIIQPKALDKPFAFQGDIENIPDESDSEMSIKNGFPYISQVDPEIGGLAPTRLQFNSILNIATDFRVFLQQGSLITFDSSLATKIGGYPKDAILSYINNLGELVEVISLMDDNNYNFVENGIDNIHWKKLNSNYQQLFDYKISDQNLTQENENWSTNDTIYPSKKFVNFSNYYKPVACQKIGTLRAEGEIKTETIAGETIDYRLATNGMKILYLTPQPNPYFLNLTGSYLLIAANGMYDIRINFSSTNLAKLQQPQLDLTDLIYFAVKNFEFTTSNNITTKQIILGKSVLSSTVSGGYDIFVENSILKIVLFNDSNTTIKYSYNSFTLQTNTKYTLSVENDCQDWSNPSNYKFRVYLKAGTGTQQVQEFSQTNLLTINTEIRIGATQNADNSISDFGLWTDFGLRNFAIEYQQLYQEKVVFDTFYAPGFKPQDKSVFVEKLNFRPFWGYSNYKNTEFILAPNFAYNYNQQVDYSVVGLLYSKSGTDFTNFSWIATDDCVAFGLFNCQGNNGLFYINGKQVAFANDYNINLTIPMKKGDVLTCNFTPTYTSNLYIYRKKYVKDAYDNRECYYYLY